MNGIQELINRKRRQVLVHSIIYYKFGTSVIDDAAFDTMAYDLVRLQKDYPEDSEAVEYMREEFRDFTGETGYDLPLHDIRAQKVAQHLLSNVEGDEDE